jgi:hypothetical protein
MFGNRTLWYTVPNHLNNYTSEKISDVFGKNKTTTSGKNTTTSAVGLLIELAESKNLVLFLYHNPHAKSPLRSPFIRNERLKEFKIASTSNYGDFIEV